MSKFFKMRKIIIPLIIVVFLIASCSGRKSARLGSPIDSTGYLSADTLVKQSSFQKEVDGKKVDLYTLRNKNGITVKITNFGACIVQILAPDRNNHYNDITLGYSSLEGYQNDKMYLGATVGRYANRIARGTFKIDGKPYHLAINNSPNSLHGGIKGFNKVVWDAAQDGNALTLVYTSKDMEEGFPGKLDVKLIYTLKENNELSIDFSAETNKNTIINLTNHSYYNLKGEGSGDILGHSLEIFADKITPVDETLIPTGKLMNVENTPFDFRKPKKIGMDIQDTLIEQIRFGKGFDHCWVLNKASDSLKLAARLSEAESGRNLEVWTTDPSIQFYSGNFMNGTVIGKGGKPYNFRNAVALEPQHYPDSPNHPEFPSVLLKPGQRYHHLIVLKFSTSAKDN
jgi:aldose 1-epimerase